MKKWCIKVTEENLPVVGKWFNGNNKSNRDYYDSYDSKDYISDYFHFPTYDTSRDRYASIFIIDGYTEITFEQFKEQILKQPNQLQEILDKIREKIYYDDYANEIVDFKDIEQIFAEYGITKTEHNF